MRLCIESRVQRKLQNVFLLGFPPITTIPRHYYFTICYYYSIFYNLRDAYIYKCRVVFLIHALKTYLRTSNGSLLVLTLYDQKYVHPVP